ncbi:MAG: septum site-determining protein MinD [Symbiobacterium sp.]|uniref:septum site-determining protein MinD n=1 Tax=Symbiobacterium sp. TaxID=1971213 RepID=UPI003463C1F6
MGQVIVVTSGKGGVGKTTTTANLGTALAQQGNKVVLVDADIGLRNLDVVMGLENRIVYDLVDVVEGNARLKQALIKDKRVENLYLLAAAQTREKKDVTAEQMRDLCEQLAREFDFVLIDCPAGIEDGFKNAIAGAQKAIIVANPEVSSVRDADRVIGLWDAQDGDRSPAMLIVNRVRPRMVARGDMLEIDDMLEMLAVDLLGVVPEDDHIIVSTNRGEPAVFSKDSKAGKAFQNIARRLMGESVPIMDLEADESIWAKFKRIVGLGRS